MSFQPFNLSTFERAGLKAAATLALCLCASVANAQNTRVTGTFKTQDQLTPSAAGLKVLATIGATPVYGRVTFRSVDTGRNNAPREITCGGIQHQPQLVPGWIKADGTLMGGDELAGVLLIPTAGCTPTGLAYEAEIFFNADAAGRRPSFTMTQYKAIPAQASVDWASLASAPVSAATDNFQPQLAATILNYETWTGISAPANPAAGFGRTFFNTASGKFECKDSAGANCMAAGSGYQTVQDEATPLAARTVVNFTGAGVTCADNAGATRTDCTIAGGGAGSQHQIDGVNLTANDTINFQDTATIDFTNPSAGAVQAAVKSDSLTNAHINSAAAIAQSKIANLTTDLAGKQPLDADLTAIAGLATTLGDVIFGNATPAWARLAGNITTTKKFFTQTGTGAASSAPTWGDVDWADIINKPLTFAPSAHALVGADHTASGLTAGQVVRASGATTFAWAQLNFADLVGSLAIGQVPNDLITYAKIQNVSATSRFLGRITAGAGDIEELTPANAATLLAEQLALADLSDVASKRGNSTQVQMTTGAAATDDCAKFDLNGNLVSAGAACGTSTGAPVGAQYVVMALDATLSAERVLAGGAGIALSDGGANGNATLATASGEADFLASGALTCGAATQGKAQVHTTPLQYCDNAATPALQYAAYGDATGAALSGDSAAGFFPAGTLEDTRLSANVVLENQANTWTAGEQDFTAVAGLRIKVGSGVPAAADCDAAGEVGRIFARSDANAANATLYICAQTSATPTFAWELTQGAGGGAPTGAQYVAMALDSTLTAERVLTGTANEITVTDGGANNNATLSLHAAVTRDAESYQSFTRAEGCTAKVSASPGETFWDVINLGTAGIDRGYWVLDDDATNDAFLTCWGQMPVDVAGTPAAKVAFDVAPQVACGASENFRVNVKYLFYASGGQPNAAHTTETAQDVSGATTAFDQTAALFPSTGSLSAAPAASNFWVLEITRDSKHANDTCAQKMLVLPESVRIVYDRVVKP